MRIPMAVLADEANVSQEGKLNLLGIFDRIAAPEFPVVHPRMVFAFRLEAEYGDAGRTLPVRVHLEDEDGQKMFDAAGEIATPMVPPGEFSTANQLFTMVGVQFPRPGTYRFVLQVGDEPAHVSPFLVQAAPKERQLN